MRVAIVGDYPLNSAQLRGGVQSAFAYLVRKLTAIDGVQVHVVTAGSRQAARSGPIERDGAQIHVLPPFPRMEFARNFSTYQSRLSRVLDRIRPDVVHAQGGTDHAYVTLRSGYPAVVTVHGVHSEDGKYSSTFRLRVRNFLYSALIERYVVRHVRHLIAISRYVTDYYRPQLRRDVQVFYVPNAIDESFFNLTNGVDRQIILFAGRLIARKRPFDLVQAFARIADRVPGAQLRIAGEGNTEKPYTGAIRAFVQSAGLGDRVQLLGELPEPSILDAFAHCSILALPSAQETTPMVIAQAMAAGKPVVATRVGGVPEMVQHEKTGLLVEAGDIGGLADALLRLLNDPALRACQGEAGRIFAIENYRADSVARRTCQAYRTIEAVTRSK